jgi:predicted dehydrogenase
MSQKLRVGLVGAGGIANAHIKAFLGIEDVEIVALWNRTKKRAEELVDKHQLNDATIYDSWQSMINDGRLDVISVVTAPQLRASPVISALESGIHVLVEKPFSTTLEEAEKMVVAAKASKRVTAVNFCHRYNEKNLIARRVIRDGTIGEIRNYSDAYRYLLPSAFSPRDRPFITESLGGLGALGEFGSHQFDMFSFLTGLPINSVSGHLFWIEPDVEDLRANAAYHLVLKSENGVCASLEHTEPRGKWGGLYWNIYIEGTRGYLSIEGRRDGKIEMRLENEDSARVMTPIEEELATPSSTNGIVADFVSAINSSIRKPILPTFEDGLRSLEVLIASLEADRKNAWVAVTR